MFRRSLVSAGGALLSLSAFGYQYFKNTYLVIPFRDTFKYCPYEKDVGLPVSDSILKLSEEVQKDLNLSPEESAGLELFVLHGLDFAVKGSIFKYDMQYFDKAVVGVPLYINPDYKHQELNRYMLDERKEPINWVAPSGKLLEESFQLSDKARKYALANHIASVQSAEPFYRAGIASLMIYATFAYCRFCNERFGHILRSFKKRCVAYFLLASFNAIMFFFMTDAVMCALEKSRDERIGKLGREYIEGGEEYYRKLMSRNVAFLDILGDKGAKVYTPTGNLKVFLRQHSLPLSARLDAFVRMKEQLKKEPVVQAPQKDDASSSKEKTSPA